MVIEDDLAEELCKFKNQENYDDKIVERILHYYKPPVLLSKMYMEKYYNDEATLRSIIASSGNICFDEPLEQYADKTIYKIILSRDRNDFPYINVFGDKIENNLSATFLKQDERIKAKKHFKALFDNAKALFVYDNYLSSDFDNNKKCNKNNIDSFIKFAQECFPKRRLDIFYPSSLEFPQKLCTDLKKICKDWEIKRNTDSTINNDYNGLHDRYIIIDRKIQIILTSGIHHLMDKKKDFTYIIRVIQ